MSNGTHLFSVLSWNIEHFSGKTSRVDRVIDTIKKQNPDIFALYEVEGSEVFHAMTRAMPGFTFHITEGTQTQEILVGHKNRSDMSAFFTQRTEFK
ncbi:MAG: hypothetical protein AAFW76_07635, partial [Pseudomonadota bacterium]